jgi:hypothetical protein
MTVFDVEADGLDDATRIHCLSYSRRGQIHTINDYGEMREWLLDQDLLIGHSITTYDIPLIERVLDIKVTARLIDTLVLSWYLEPHRPRHGLEGYGVDFGIPKPPVVDCQDQLPTMGESAQETIRVVRQP